MVDNLKEMFLETLHDLSISVAFLRNEEILPYEVEILSTRCKISTDEVFKVLERAKKENWRRKWWLPITI
mgnify:FL=1